MVRNIIPAYGFQGESGGGRAWATPGRAWEPAIAANAAAGCPCLNLTLLCAPGKPANLRLQSARSRSMLAVRHLQGAPLLAPDVT